MKFLIFSLIALSFSFSQAELAGESVSEDPRVEIEEYLNSLSHEELVELHELKRKIEMGYARNMVLQFLGGGSILFSGIKISDLVEDRAIRKTRGLTDPEDIKRVRGKYAWLRRGAGTLSIAGALVMFLSPLGFQDLDLGFDYDEIRYEDAIRSAVREHLSEMTLEELREHALLLEALSKLMDNSLEAEDSSQ